MLLRLDHTRPCSSHGLCVGHVLTGTPFSVLHIYLVIVSLSFFRWHFSMRLNLVTLLKSLFCTSFSWFHLIYYTVFCLFVFTCLFFSFPYYLLPFKCCIIFLFSLVSTLPGINISLMGQRYLHPKHVKRGSVHIKYLVNACWLINETGAGMTLKNLLIWGKLTGIFEAIWLEESWEVSNKGKSGPNHLLMWGEYI